MGDSFYNTTHEHGRLLRKFEVKAKTQEELVLEFFNENPTLLITRSSLHTKVMQDCPVSSIVRALANLTKRGLLEKTDMKRMGDCGRPVYCWRLSWGATSDGQFELPLAGRS